MTDKKSPTNCLKLSENALFHLYKKAADLIFTVDNVRRVSEQFPLPLNQIMQIIRGQSCMMVIAGTEGLNSFDTLEKDYDQAAVQQAIEEIGSFPAIEAYAKVKIRELITQPEIVGMAANETINALQKAFSPRKPKPEREYKPKTNEPTLGDQLSDFFSKAEKEIGGEE